MIGWISLAATTIVGVIGLYLVHSLRRKTAAEIAARRLDAYGALWELTERAASSRLTAPGGRGPLSWRERQELFDAMTHWYYEGGHGMLLPPRTRDVYFQAKDNLVRAAVHLKPPAVASAVQDATRPDAFHGEVSIDQLSLLRSMMRFDVGQFGSPYFGELSELDCAFLAECRVDLTRRPWRRFAPKSRRGPRWRALLRRQRG